MKQYSAIFLCFLMLCLGGNAFAAEKPAGDYIVLLHGIVRSSSHMKYLEQYLRKQGYDVINLNYPSTNYKLEQLVGIIHDDLSKTLVEDKPVHFIGHSMGGLLVRAVIHKHRPQNLGRVVQLAAPNNGSEVADILKNYWLYKKVYGPAGQQLTTDKDLSSLFGEVDYELGVIAGNSTIHPISSIIIPGEDDGRVSIKSTKLNGMKDHIIVSASHMFFPINNTVHLQTEHFLKYGVFNKYSGE